MGDYIESLQLIATYRVVLEVGELCERLPVGGIFGHQPAVWIERFRVGV